MIEHTRSVMAALTLPFEVLNFFFMFFSSRAGFERAEISSLASLGIFLLRVKSVFARLKFANHNGTSYIGE